MELHMDFEEVARDEDIVADEDDGLTACFADAVVASRCRPLVFLAKQRCSALDCQRLRRPVVDHDDFVLIGRERLIRQPGEALVEKFLAAVRGNHDRNQRGHDAW